MIALAILLTVLQAFDGWTTYKIIRRGGYERNSLVAGLIEKIGLYPALLLLKLGAAVLVWVLVLLPTVDRLTESLQWLGLLGAGAFYVWVAVKNWKVYRK